MTTCTAYIDGISPGPEGTAVALRPPSGRLVTWVTDCQPDHDAASELMDRHPNVFAVRLTPQGDAMACAVVVATGHGGQTVVASIEVGLALCESGVHGTVQTSAAWLRSMQAQSAS